MLHLAQDGCRRRVSLVVTAPSEGMSFAGPLNKAHEMQLMRGLRVRAGAQRECKHAKTLSWIGTALRIGTLAEHCLSTVNAT